MDVTSAMTYVQRLLLGAVALGGAVMPACGATTAVTVNPVYQFSAYSNATLVNKSGASATGVTFGPDGALYGIATLAGPNRVGGIFRVTLAGQEKLIYPFAAGAATSFSKLVLGSDGNFYGTTGLGSHDEGTIFRVTPKGAFTVISSFACPRRCRGGKNKQPDATGYNPNGDLLEVSPGTFVGAVVNGGTEGVGGLFSVTTTGTRTLLASFPKASGGFPNGHLAQDSNGVLYGTFAAAVVHGTGGIFSYSNGTLTILHIFDKRTEGDAPQAGLLLASDGFLYGTTGFDGPGGYGTVFKASTDGQVTVLDTFNGTDRGGTPQDALVEGPDGMLYGETPYDGSSGGYLGGAGTLFRIAKGGAGGLQVLYDFTLSSDRFFSPTGALPFGSLAIGGDGTFYGATYNNCGFTFFCSSPSNSGSVFSFRP